MSSTAPAQADDAAIIRVLQASKAAAAAGRMAESDQLLARIAQQAPHHPAVLNELGVRMLGRGAAEQANALFVRATTADPNNAQAWQHLALTCAQQASWYPRAMAAIVPPMTSVVSPYASLVSTTPGTAS